MKRPSSAKNGDIRDQDQQSSNRSMRIRLRAAWMYYVEQMTQAEIAETMQIGRVTVTRLLAEAAQRKEVKIAIEGELKETVALERRLERRFGLAEAIVAPVSPQGDRTRVVSAAAAKYISDFVHSGMRLGVGWGRTLIESLAFMESRPLSHFTVVSLLGGISQARSFNPSEYAWLLAKAFGGDCYLLAAPVLVDSAATRNTLIEKCGLGEIFRMAEVLDAVILSVGGLVAEATTYQVGFLLESDRLSLAAKGAVGDLLYHFYDRNGMLVDHPINERVMSVPVETIRSIPRRVLTSGGAEKTIALLGAMKLIRPTVFVTDERTAAELLAAAGEDVHSRPAEEADDSGRPVRNKG
jgi:DNA-binding transcriptional regulator LsrR (DeoR family)